MKWLVIVISAIFLFWIETKIYDALFKAFNSLPDAEATGLSLLISVISFIVLIAGVYRVSKAIFKNNKE